MKPTVVTAATIVLMLGGMLFSPATAESVQEGQVLGRGPIHEAFATVINYDPTPGVVAPRKPPERVEELPPPRPTGENLRWIPGYWAWDEERDDFIWVSGGWRNAPPNRRWIPGYWDEVADGYRWISGFWQDESSESLEYLPLPPSSLDEGPTSASPSTDHFWIPGCWIWKDGAYAWRPGFWFRATPGWIWIPSHFRYTPRGAVLIVGYWDYELTRRGRLYAPVYFAHAGDPAGRYYRPASVVELGVLTASLFIHPKHYHYYYGDYYAASYYDRGYHPWHRFGAHYRGYDPLFSYYLWHHRHRGDGDWATGVARKFQSRQDQPNLRPPRVIEKAAVRQQDPQPIVRSPEEVDSGIGEVEPQTSEASRQWIEHNRRLRRERQQAEIRDRFQPSPESESGQQPKAQPAIQNPTPRRKATPPEEFPRWRMPDRESQPLSAPARGDRVKVPDRPKPPKQLDVSGPKSGPKSRPPQATPAPKTRSGGSKN